MGLELKGKITEAIGKRKMPNLYSSKPVDLRNQHGTK